MLLPKSTTISQTFPCVIGVHNPQLPRLLRNRVQICRRSRRAYQKKLKDIRKNRPRRIEPAIDSDPATEPDVDCEADADVDCETDVG